MRSLTKYYKGHQIKEDVIHKVCSMLERGEKCTKLFGQKTQWEETTWKT